MKKYVFIIFFALLTKQLFPMEQLFPMKNDDIDINYIKDPAILRKDIFKITEALLDDKTSIQKRIKLNNTLAPIYVRLIEIHQKNISEITEALLDVKTNPQKFNELNNKFAPPIYERLIEIPQIKDDMKKNEEIEEIAMIAAKNFCYGVIDDIKSSTQEENCFKRDNYFAYQSIIARLYEIHYKLEEIKLEEIPEELKKARKFLQIKASLYKKKMEVQETDLLIKLQESEEQSNFLEKTQQSKISLDSKLKKAKEDFKIIQESLPPNTTNVRLLEKVRKSRKKIDLLEKKNVLLDLGNTENKDIDIKLKKTQYKIQRIKTSLAYLRNDLKTIEKIPQDIIKIDFSAKRTNT